MVKDDLLFIITVLSLIQFYCRNEVWKYWFAYILFVLCFLLIYGFLLIHVFCCFCLCFCWFHGTLRYCTQLKIKMINMLSEISLVCLKGRLRRVHFFPIRIQGYRRHSRDGLSLLVGCNGRLHPGKHHTLAETYDVGPAALVPICCLAGSKTWSLYVMNFVQIRA